MAHWPDHMHAKEGECLNRYLTAAFDAGFEVEVWYGDGLGDPDEDRAVPFTQDRAAIQRETAATCITHWRLREKDTGTYVGLLAFVHGNEPYEVLNDMAGPGQAGLDRLSAIFDPVGERCEELYG